MIWYCFFVGLKFPITRNLDDQLKHKENPGRTKTILMKWHVRRWFAIAWLWLLQFSIRLSLISDYERIELNYIRTSYGPQQICMNRNLSCSRRAILPEESISKFAVRLYVVRHPRKWALFGFQNLTCIFRFANDEILLNALENAVIMILFV